MKRIIMILTFALTFASVFAADILPNDYKGMTSKRRVCVKRERLVIGGVTNNVTYWHRDGRPDWIRPAVETNAVRQMKGAKQNNAIENARQAAEVEAAPSREIKAKAKKAAKKDAKTFEKAVKDLEKARDKSSSEEFKELYQRTLDLWKSEVNGK